MADITGPTPTSATGHPQTNDSVTPKFGIQAAAFQKEIHVGRLNKARTAFVDGKEVATDMAIRAVAVYVFRHFAGALHAQFSDFDVEIRVTRKSTISTEHDHNG